MKKILFLIQNLTGGGAEKVLVDLVNSLSPHKYEVTVQTIRDEGIYKDKLCPHIRYKSIVTNKKILGNRWLYRLLIYGGTNVMIYKRFVKGDYDIEISFLEGKTTEIIAASTNTKAQKYAWVHLDLYTFFNVKRKNKSISKYINEYKKFDQIFCVSESAKQGFKKRFGFDDNVQVMYNLLDDDAIRKKAALPLTNAPEKRTFRLITVGRLTYQKGYDRLVRICKQLKDEGCSFELWILGEGEERIDLEKYIIENELKEVKLLGFKLNPYQYMAQCDLFVCSSRAEGFSLVVAESLILGIPVVSVDCAGPNELLEFGKDGLLVENTDQALHDGIIKMMTDSNLYEYYKVNSQKRGKDFKKENRLKEIEEILSR